MKRVASGSLTVTLHRPINSCVSLLSAHLPSSTGVWKPSSIHSTTASFSGYVFVYSKLGDIGVTVPNTGGTARMTGSFAGTDHGARSFATAYTKMTPSQFEAACYSAAGLSGEAIISGTARFA